MVAIAAVRKRHDVGDRRRRRRGPPLGEQVGRFVLVLHQAGLGRVGLREDEMAGHAKAGGLPGVEKQVDLVPAVERNAHGIAFQNAEHFGERRRQPVAVHVVRDRAAAAIAKIYEVRRVRHDAVDGFGGEFGHGDQAVAVVQIAHGQLHRVEIGAAGAMRLANRATRSWRAPAGEWRARGPWNTGVREAREDMPRKPLAGAGRRATFVAHGATVRPPGHGGRTWAPG